MARIARVNLTGVSPIAWSRFHNTPKLDKELADDYEKRTWRERFHVNQDGECVIPPFAFKLPPRPAVRPGRGGSMNAEVIRVLQNERDYINNVIVSIHNRSATGDPVEWEDYRRDVIKAIRVEIQRPDPLPKDDTAPRMHRMMAWRKLARAEHNARIPYQRGGAPSPTNLGDISEATRELREMGEKI